MPASALHPDVETLRAVRGVELRSRLVVEGLLSGGHRTPLSGVSTEFAQHRPYVAGDDLRHLDWKVLARTDKAHLRQFERESQLELLLAVDRSASMRFAAGGEAAWRKFDHAAVLAGTLAHLGVQQRDRVGLVLFDSAVAGGLPSSNASGQAEQVTSALEAAGVEEAAASGLPGDEGAGAETGGDREGADEGAGLVAAAGWLAGAGGTGRRALVVVISDLLAPVASLEQALGRLRHGGRDHDAMVLQVLDPAERDLGVGPGADDPAEFVGLESGRRIGADPRALRKAYREAVEAHLRAVEACCTRFGYDHRLITTDQRPGAALAEVLASRV